MAVNVLMPQSGDGLEVGMVKEWLKVEGDAVRKGESIVVIESEKISLEVPAPADGILRRILVQGNSEAPILSVIGVIADADEELT